MRLRIHIDTGKDQGCTRRHSDVPLETSGAGSQGELPQRSEMGLAVAWDRVCEGRQKWLDGLQDVDLVLNDRRTHWVGGALAVYCAVSGEDGTVVHNRLLREMPQPGMDNSNLSPGELPMQPDVRKRPAPHPGAQRTVTEDEPVMEPAEASIPEHIPLSNVGGLDDDVDGGVPLGDADVTVTKVEDNA